MKGVQESKYSAHPSMKPFRYFPIAFPDLKAEEDQLKVVKRRTRFHVRRLLLRARRCLLFVCLY